MKHARSIHVQVARAVKIDLAMQTHERPLMRLANKAAALTLAAAVGPGFIGARVARSQPEDPAMGQADAPKPAQAQVPVKQVGLFSSGVGYFEQFCTVKGDGSTELRFKTKQINDIHKSLVLQDRDGGRVTTVTYPSLDPVTKTLKSFQIDITANPSL